MLLLGFEYWTNNFLNSANKCQSYPTHLDYLRIKFKDETHRKRFEVLAQRDISPTRHADDSCLRTLGLYDSVSWMFERIGWSHFLTLQHLTYERLTLEFPSSFSYIY